MPVNRYKILYLEDSDLDAELVTSRLQRSDLPLDIDRACTRLEFETKLRANVYAVILSDYQVPKFDGTESLAVARQIQPETPFIYVSGAMGEELAVETLKRGATDYVLKQRLMRLPSAVARAIQDVGERNARLTSEAAFRDAQESLRFAQDAAGLGAWELDLATYEITCTPLCKSSLGLAADTRVTYSSLLELINPSDRQRVESAIECSIQSRSIFDVEFPLSSMDTESSWVYLRGRYVPGSSSHSSKMSGISLDVTERKRSEQRLRDSESQFRAIVEANPECVKIVASDGTLLQMNRAGLKMVETDSADEVIGKCVYDIIAPEFRQAFREFNERVCLGYSGRLEFDIIGRQGTRRHMETNAVPFSGLDGRVSQLAITRDVTARKHTEKALRQSEEQFRHMAEQIPNLAWMARADGHVFWYNSRWYKFTGRTPVEMQGWGWKDIHDPNVLPVVMERWNEALATGQAFEMVFPLRAADGVYHHFLTLVHPFRGANNEILYWFGTNTDISAQKENEERLKYIASHERHRADLLADLAFASKTVNSVLSVEGIIRVLASEARRILSANLATVVLTPASDQAEPLRVISISDAYEILPEADREERINFVLENDLGARVALVGHLGNQLGYVQVDDKSDGEFSAEDISALGQLANIASAGMENARLYETLRGQDQRKDEFLATLAHELRNPLAPLRNALGVLRLDPNRPGGELVSLMERQLSHMVRLIDDLLDSSRISRNKLELRRSTVLFSDIINNAVETSRPLADSAGHQLTIRIPDEPIYLDGDLTRLAQVFSNLLSNSAKYTDRGHISLTAVREGNVVVTAVTDNGIGIPPDSLSRIFDMFWQVDRSIERQTGGLGIGLALVKGITEMHGGTIIATSEGAGKGSTFTVRLPILATTSGEETPFPAGESPQPDNRRKRRILVVDDNVDSANSMSMMLDILGNEVATAHDGLRAIQEVHRFNPEVILMDVGMPNLNGYEATRRIRETKGGRTIKIVALTGWGQTSDRERSREAGCDGHLVKPVDLADLQKLLADVQS